MIDCVSREAVIETIKTYATMLWQKYYEPFPESTVLELIQSLPSVQPERPKGEWIPVNERLPEEDGEYLLWGRVIEDEDNNIFIGDYDSCAEAFGYWQDYYDPSTLGYVDGELLEYASVIAWMPLPEPYKEESEA